MSVINQEPRIISQGAFTLAKRFWIFAISTRLLSACFGLFFTFYPIFPSLAPWILAVFAISFEVLQWRSEYLRGQAERLKRKIELMDGFGWPISGRDMSDVLTKFSRKKQEKFAKSVTENYFASSQSTGSRRVLENLMESSWWSKHLSGAMAIICGCFVVAIVLLSVFAFALAIETVNEHVVLVSVSRIVCAGFSLIVSLGMSRLCVGYAAFSKSAESTEHQAERLLVSGTEPSESEVLNLLHEYQLARGSSPLVPTVIWRVKRDRLNELWTEYRAEGGIQSK